jgi:hypothetical protein
MNMVHKALIIKSGWRDSNPRPPAPHALRSGFHFAASLALQSKTEIRCAHNRFAATFIADEKKKPSPFTPKTQR